MSEPYIGEIRMFAGNFAPRSWALCDGQLLSVSQNDALFSLLGTIYGGDGRTTFALPDMRGRIPIHQGHGAGLTDRRIGSRFGSEQETLSVSELPSHSHAFQASPTGADTGYPQQVTVADTGTVSTYNADTGAAGGEDFDSSAVTDAGGDRAHNNIMPYQCVNFIIALFGIYPSRS